jgi:hypothetical protein
MNTLYGTPKSRLWASNYDMWLGPLRGLRIPTARLDRGLALHQRLRHLAVLNGAWGIHDIDIAQWVANADNTGPVEVEGTQTILHRYRDVPHEYTVEHKSPMHPP